MLSGELFILTPFHRKQIILNKSLITEPDLSFKSYQFLVFRSRLEPFLQCYLKNYNYFIFKDVPYDDLMITTIELFDLHQCKLELSRKQIKDINQEIARFTSLHPNYFLFISDNLINLPRAWIRTILPSFIFERTIYHVDRSIRKRIPSIYHHGNIYLDLSDDLSYDLTLKRLYSTFIETLNEYYRTGTLPNMNDKNKRISGEFIHFHDMDGEQVLEQLSSFPRIEIPESNYKIIYDKVQDGEQGKTQGEEQGKVQGGEQVKEEEDSTIFVLNFTKTEREDVLFDPLISEFIVSLKRFLDADNIEVKEVVDGYYEISVMKDDLWMQSNVDVNEMFGYFYFTDDPIGLLVANDMKIQNDIKILYDSINGKGGIFVPIEYLGDIIQRDLLNLLLDNRKMYMDAYTKTKEIKDSIVKFGLTIVLETDDYLFVEKNPYFTQRVIYRSLVQEYPSLLLSGSWENDYVIDFAKKILRERKRSEDVKMGPFSTLIVKGHSVSDLIEFYETLEKRLDSKKLF